MLGEDLGDAAGEQAVGVGRVDARAAGREERVEVGLAVAVRQVLELLVPLLAHA